jgi:predicted ATPase/class 3 adenylate cyclase
MGGAAVTTTILFTDIESSTRSWEIDPAGMAETVRRHDEALAAAIADHGGVLVKGLGDGVMASFGSAAAAIAAAVDIQQRIAALGSIRVRVGVHTGDVELRGDDLFGPAVNRAARLMATGHGGQIVVSSSTAAAAGPGLPEGAELRDLGVHRLKDLTASERVFQVVHPDLQVDFPPLRSLAGNRTNLPVQLTPLVGRISELAEIGGMLDEHRLVTLTGPGGVGKTRTAVQAAADAIDRFPDGVWWVELAGSEAGDVLRQVASAIGVAEVAGVSLEATLAEELDGTQTLIVTDNFEHVLAAAPPLSAVLASTTGVTVLATSRAPLGLQGEVSYRLDPLVSIDDGTDLFVARASEADPRIDWSAGAREAARSIAERLDGLPLAIELAAAQCRVLSPAALAARIGSHLDSLRGGRDRMSHHQTIDGLVDWSYRLLTADEAIVFERLSVFAGSFELEAAEQVGGEPSVSSPIDALLSLADQSLLQPVGEDVARFRMLDTVRAHARRRLHERGAAEDAEVAHTRWYLERAGAVDGVLRGSDQEKWHRRLALDMDDFRAALRRLLGAGDGDRAMTMAAGLGRLWYQQGHGAEAIEWYERIVPRASVAPTEDRALALTWWATVVSNTGRHDVRAGELLDEAEDAAEAAASPLALAYLANLRAIRALGGGDLRGAVEGFRLAALRQEAIDPSWSTAPSFNLGVTLIELGELEEAEAVTMTLLQRAETAGDRWGADSARELAGLIALERGDLDRAEHLYVHVLEGFRAISTAVDQFNGLQGLADIAAERGDVEAADRLAADAETVATSAGFRIGMRPAMARAMARVRAGDTLAALPLLAAATIVPVESEAEKAWMCLTIAEALAAAGRAHDAGIFLAAYDEWCHERRVRLTPWRASRRERVASQAALPDGPPPGLDQALETAGSILSGPPTED